LPPRRSVDALTKGGISGFWKPYFVVVLVVEERPILLAGNGAIEIVKIF
jgi:hypothetical protein